VKTAQARGDITGLIHAAGVSPSQAPPEVILKVDLYGTALVLELFGDVIAEGGWTMSSAGAPQTFSECRLAVH